MDTYGQKAGMGAERTTSEKVIWWGTESRNLYVNNSLLDAACVDAGNTPTTDLRAGLLLGKHTSGGTLYAWDPDATTGIEVVDAVLLRDIPMLDDTGTAVQKQAHVIVSGSLKVADLLIQGTAFTSSGDEHLARRQMTGAGRFILDDDYASKAAFLGPPIKTKTVTGDTTLTAADNGTLFVVNGAGASNMTLPTLETGLVFEFISNADQNMTVTSAAGNDIIAVNDAAASSIAASTSSQKIGAHFRVQSVYVGTTKKWMATNLSVGVTMTIA